MLFVADVIWKPRWPAKWLMSQYHDTTTAKTDSITSQPQNPNLALILSRGPRRNVASMNVSKLPRFTSRPHIYLSKFRYNLLQLGRLLRVHDLETLCLRGIEQFLVRADEDRALSELRQRLTAG